MADKRSLAEDVKAGSATRPNWASLALLLLALIAAAPLWAGPGLVNTRSGGDSPFLFIRLHQLVENLRAGVFPVRWMPDAAYGLGYPFFNFYAALPYYFAAVFNLIGFDLLASIKIVQTLGFVFAAWGMYRWVRSASGDASYNPIAWLAAVAYTFAPFHLVNAYVRGDSLSEFYAFVFYPLILWAIDAVIDRPRPQSVALLGLAYGGLIMTHNISALIFSPFVVLYVILRSCRLEVGAWRARPDRLRPSSFVLRHSAFNILHSALGLVLGFLLSAWFWLPVLGEAPFVQLDVQTTGYFNYAEHFRSADMVQSSIDFDYDTEPPHTPFAMGLAQAIATIAGMSAIIVTWRRGSSRLWIFALVGLAASTLMITPLSKPLWDTLPLLPLAQFPWRFLSVQALFASLTIGYLAFIPIALAARVLAGGSGLALAASALLSLRPDYLPIRADEITPERIQLYEAFTANIGTTIRAEYLPRTAVPRPYTGPALIDPAAPPRTITVRGEAEAIRISHGPISQAWTIRAARDSTLAFPTLYFPGWQASLDGQPVDARAAVDLGYVEVDVPAGEHTLALSFGRTPIRAGADIVSVLAALGVVGMLVFKRRRAHGEGGRHGTLVVGLSSFVSVKRYEIFVLASACVLAVIATSANRVEARDDNLVMDFESKPWLHHGANTVGLVRYEYAGSCAPGRPFGVTLESADAAAGSEAAVELVAPSLHAFGGLEPIASASAPIRAGANHYTLDIPASLSSGMYYARVDVRDASGRSRPTFLKPIYCTGSSVPESPGWARIGGEIELKAVRLQHVVPDQLAVAFDWAALRPVAANYAVSLRLQDANGRVWVSLDTQPGYGFRPTSVWRPGENQHDVYTLALPPDVPRDAPYSLDAVWYRAASKQEIGRVRVSAISIQSPYGLTEMLPPPRSFDVPPMQYRVDAMFGGVIKLLGYDLRQAGNRLGLTLHWQALADLGADYKFFVHVFDPATERIVAQVDAMPGRNAYPTSRWVKGEVVSETIDLLIGESGTYRVATGWYDPVSADRLAALGTNGKSFPANRAILGEDVVVP